MVSSTLSSLVFGTLLAFISLPAALAKGGPPDHVIEKQKERLSIKKEKKIKAQKVKKKIRLDGQLYSLEAEDLEPFEAPISRSTIFIINGAERSRPPNSNLFTSKQDSSVIFAFGGNGKLKRASKRNGGSKKMAVPVDGEDDFFIEYSEDDLDYDQINSKYSLEYIDVPEGEGDDSRSRSLRRRAADYPGTANKRELQSGCTELDELEVAIAFDTSFCDDYGSEEDAIDRIYETVATASTFYEEDNVCMKVVVSVIDGYCNPSSDPYKTLVDSYNDIGCTPGVQGLLQGFKDYWTANRPLASYPRDTAHLFYGTDVEPSSTTIGCAYIEVMCNFWYGYGVNEMSDQNSPTSLQEQLFAHELGHNVGSSHDSSCNPQRIMCPFITSATTFSSSSASSMQSHVGSQSCIATVPVGPPPTPSPPPPPPPPTPPAPTPTPAPQAGPSTVDVTFYIQFDYYPEDYGFEVTAADDENDVYYSEPTGGWSSEPSFGAVLLTFQLPAAQDFTLHFYDSWGDGLGVWANGWYGLYFGTSVDPAKALVVDLDFYGSISYRATDFTTVDPSA